MSDEPKVLAATVMRSLPSGAYHARRALGSLESQNEALQEENVKLVQNAGVAAEVLDALRERAERAEELLRTAPPFVGVWNVSGRRSVDERDLSLFVESYNAWAEAARNALSPTQETDPEWYEDGFRNQPPGIISSHPVVHFDDETTQEANQ